MKKIVKIYQTLTDRDNPDYILDNGPFKCNHHNAWLGTGYYFWDTFIENAHWWGKDWLNQPYIICEAKISIDEDSCFDLVGNTNHMLEFENALNFLKTKKIANSSSNVAKIINYLKTINTFNYSCVRVNGINSKSRHLQPNYQLKFETNRTAHLEYKPPIQFCVFNFDKLDFKDYKIIYPDYYTDDYVI